MGRKRDYVTDQSALLSPFQIGWWFLLRDLYLTFPWLYLLFSDLMLAEYTCAECRLTPNPNLIANDNRIFGDVLFYQEVYVYHSRTTQITTSLGSPTFRHVGLMSNQCRIEGFCFLGFSLQWRHNGRDAVSNYLPHECLLNRLFRRRSKKTSKLRVTGLCARNWPMTGELPAQMASNADNVSIWWRHHVSITTQKKNMHHMFCIHCAVGIRTDWNRERPPQYDRYRVIVCIPPGS